jgi:hypothetical protein
MANARAECEETPFLPKLSPRKTEENIQRGMDALAQALGKSLESFACPSGAGTPATRASLTPRGCLGGLFAGSSGLNADSPDRVTLSRVGVPGWAGLSNFYFRLSRAYGLTRRVWQVWDKRLGKRSCEFS